MDGWNSGSSRVFATPFAENGDLVGFDGTHLKGREEIDSFHQHFLTLMSKEAVPLEGSGIYDF
jgi:uncharacterized protein (TIGR02246 family)